ncbi:MAG: hypothetical protein E6R04_01000 [Spirochaetes bacterium]|nr:MAG: hypothetical protein E6R04_01000 [Spirochaetota bacterium]
MTTTSFLDNSALLPSIQQANEKMKSTLGRIETSLSSQGYPLKKETYHFLTKVLEPSNRIERTLYMLLFQAAYQSEMLSAGSAYFAIRFANEFISQLLKIPNLTERNEVELMEVFEQVAGYWNKAVCTHSKNVTEEELKEEIRAISEDKELCEALLQAITVCGLEGKIHIEDSISNTYVVEQKSGYFFSSVKPFKFFIPALGLWEVTNPKVMLVDGVIEQVSELDKILNGALETKIPVLLIAHGFSEEVISTIKVNVDHGKFNIMPVRLTTELDSLNVLNDIATVCGAEIVSTLKGDMVCLVPFDSLPVVEKVKLTPRELNIENAKTRRGVSNQIRMLLEKRQEQQHISDLSDLIDKRIQGLLAASVALRLPNMPPSKRENTKVRIDVALRQAKTLLTNGRVDFSDAFCFGMSEDYSFCDPVANAFYATLLKLEFEEFQGKKIPSLTAWASVYLAGKAVVRLLTTGGLVVITD